MYSIMRFSSDQENKNIIIEFGKSLNEAKPGLYEGLHKKGCSFSCDISKSMLWEEQYKDILSFVCEIRSVLEKRSKNQVRITVDIAIDNEDFAQNTFILSLHSYPELLRILGETGIALEISIYIPEAWQHNKLMQP